MSEVLFVSSALLYEKDAPFEQVKASDITEVLRKNPNVLDLEFLLEIYYPEFQE